MIVLRVSQKQEIYNAMNVTRDKTDKQRCLIILSRAMKIQKNPRNLVSKNSLAYATGPFIKGLEGIPRWGGIHNQSYLQFQIRDGQERLENREVEKDGDMCVTKGCDKQSDSIKDCRGGGERNVFCGGFGIITLYKVIYKGALSLPLTSHTSCVCHTVLSRYTIQQPTETSKQPIRTRYLVGYQPIRDQYFLIRSVHATYHFNLRRQGFLGIESWLASLETIHFDVIRRHHSGRKVDFTND
eukprot:sb/3469046/